MMPNSSNIRGSCKLSILVPVYNEKYTLEQVVEAALASRLPEGVEREVILVDDASTDGSGELVDQLAARYDRVLAFHHRMNEGKGAAVRTAIRHASGTVGVIQDADLEYDPRDFARLIDPILQGEADAVFGSRFLSSERRRVLYFWHSLGNRFLTTLSNMMTGLNLTDMETCYKAVRMPILKSTPIRCRRFGIEPEITAKLAKRGCRIFEVPVSYRGRTYLEGKKITWKDGLRAVAAIFYFKLMDDLYDKDLDKAILRSLSSTHRFNVWMADTIRPYIGERVLEIGAGLGNLTAHFLPRESYAATDVDPHYIEYLRGRYDGNRRVSVTYLDVTDSNGFAGRSQRYDTVICLNVIEHVQDDLTALRNIRDALEPGGAACLLVPRGPAIYGTLDRTLGHVRRYTGEQWRERIEMAGLTCERILHFNRIGLPAWWWNGRVLRRSHFGKLQLKLFDASIWLWRRVDRFLPWPGLSVIAIARKNKEP